MSDIHGCYDIFQIMLKEIGFSHTDFMIIAGDYIDRGEQSFEMLKWIERCPNNVRLIRGNHEEEFAKYVDLLIQLDRKMGLDSDFASREDTLALYDSLQYIFKKKKSPVSYFDLYGTIRDLLVYFGVTLEDLSGWADIIRKMPYYYELEIGNRTCIVVHAGYIEEIENVSTMFSEPEEFYLYAREEGYQLGGKQHGMIVAGHTPTIVKGEFTYSKGQVFRYYDKEKDCMFYDIDCGCVFRGREPDAKLACIRLEDEKIFYA